jgi:hypothetical protein
VKEFLNIYLDFDDTLNIRLRIITTDYKFTEVDDFIEDSFKKIIENISLNYAIYLPCFAVIYVPGKRRL